MRAMPFRQVQLLLRLLTRRERFVSRGLMCWTTRTLP
jgi:hypothetical protein